MQHQEPYPLSKSEFLMRSKTVLLELAGFLLLIGSVPFAVNAQSTKVDTLRSFLPREAGEIERSSVDIMGTMVFSTYKAAEEPSVILIMGYGLEAQQEARKNLEEMRKDAKTHSTLTINGQTVYIGVDSSKIGAVALPGKAVVLGLVRAKNRQSWDGEEARETLMMVLRELNWDRLAALNLSLGNVIEPVNDKKLRALLPKKVDGLETDSRTSWSFGQSSTAEGIYRGKIKYPEAGKSTVSSESQWITVHISDIGAVPKSEVPEKFDWTTREVGYKVKDGDQRTTEKVIRYQNLKAHIQLIPGMDFRRIDVFVAERFVVEVKGKNVKMEKLKDVLGFIDLNKLAELAK